MQLEIIGTDGTVHYTRPHDHPDVWEALLTPGYSVRGTGEKRASGSLHPACCAAPCVRSPNDKVSDGGPLTHELKPKREPAVRCTEC